MQIRYGTGKRLSDIKTGNTAVITRVDGFGAFRKRITEMGFIKGKLVKVVKNAPLQDPIEYEILGYNISLRRSEANLIEVLSPEEAKNPFQLPYEGVLAEQKTNNPTIKSNHIINVALVGNPNSGKTTLFNYASGSRERVGNYGGVTVDSKEAKIYNEGFTINLVDLPGTYSITEYTPEELYVREHILKNKPDIVVNVVDASNLERNLFLTTQLIDMNLKVVIALNMYDELEQKGIQFNHIALGSMLGIPIIPTIAVKGKGIPEMINKVIEVYEDKDPHVRHININYGHTIEESIQHLETELKKCNLSNQFPERYLSIKLLENEKSTIDSLRTLSSYDIIAQKSREEIHKLEKEYNESSETVLTDAKYGFISGALRETCSQYSKEHKKKVDVDYSLTHKFWGFPIFIFLMWLMFQSTFSLGTFPQDWITKGVNLLGELVKNVMPEGSLQDLLVDGIIGGVGGVIVFLPNILILFFFISVMEDTGYMARVSFIMDKLMHKIGLHGKSFIPLLMGFGCNVPAIMATRTLENRKDRMLTMLIIPFMSCSARLPVYILLISAFFPKNQGLILISIYMAGIIIAVLSALLLKSTLFRKQEVPFVMELPTYRIPTLRNTARHMWFKAVQYLRKMGTVILMASVLIWALSYYPRNVRYSRDYDTSIRKIELSNVPGSDKKTKIAELEILKQAEHQEKSYIGQMGHFIEPLIKPLGFDWKIGISIITGLAAKEIVVSSMGVLYQAGQNAEETSSDLTGKLQQQEYQSGELKGEKVFTPLVAFGFMLFVLIYFPCIASIAAIRKESSWRWSVFTMSYTTVVAWIVSFIVHQAGSLIL
jgi:ferrous iron transport protein B